MLGGRLRNTKLVLFAAIIVTVGCQGPGPGPASSGGQPGPQSSPASEQVFRFNLASEPPGLDPQYASWDASVSVLQSVFDGLLEFNEELRPTPSVAREVPSLDNGGISADGKTYTFKLRTDYRWTDGQPVTAKDFVYAVRRLFDPDKGAQYADLYFSIVGAEEYFTARGTRDAPKTVSDAELQALRDRVGVRAIDDQTLEIRLKEPRASFVDLAALWLLFPIREDVVQQHGDRWTDASNMVSNGPFRMAEWTPNVQIVLVPNPHFPGPERPRLTRIVLRVITDSNAEYAAYQNGELDGARIPTALTAQALGDERLRAEVHRGPRLSTFAYQFNMKRPPFDRREVRQAFSMAINREAFINQVRQGIGKPAYSWIPPGMAGHQPDLGKDVNRFDPAAARRLLAEAGYPEGRGLPPISFQYANTRDNPLRAQFLQGQLRENLGVDISLEPMETASFSRFVSANQHHLANVGWNADYPDTDNWLPTIFGTGAGNNHTQYSNPQIDELMARAMADPDEGRRLALWAQAQETIVRDVPMIFLFVDESFYLFKPYVQGIKLTGMDGSSLPSRLFMHRVWIANH
jgi:oligopeptide transport system substrate-binding protein